MVEPKYLLDSNACIYLIEGLSDALRARIETYAPGEIVTSAIVYAEVGVGVDSADKSSVANFNRLFDVVGILPFDTPASATYWRLPFRRARFDRLIAAHALAANLVLITNNLRDFADVPGLKVEDWTR